MSRAFVVAAATLLAVGCTGGSAGDGAPGTADAATSTGADAVVGAEVALPSSIECGTQYRPNADDLDDAEEATLTVEPTSGPAAEPEALTFPTMTLSVAYLGDAPEGRNVTVTVTTDAGEPLVHTLYQLGEMPLDEIDFAGGHGFTGLQYVDHGDALLQVWCTAHR